jgi:NADH:ubiquinone oxidoreductase subunit 3 (subunit A)
MNGILQNYLPLVVFIGVASLIGLALLIAPFLVAVQQPDPEKLSTYECGFNPFDDARMKFDVRYYLVAILFIIFDLEVAFLFPSQAALAPFPHVLEKAVHGRCTAKQASTHWIARLRHRHFAQWRVCTFP